MVDAWNALLDTVDTIQTVGVGFMPQVPNLLAPKIPVTQAPVNAGKNRKTVNYQFFNLSPDAQWKVVLPHASSQPVTEQQFRDCNGDPAAIADLVARTYRSGLCDMPFHQITMGADSFGYESRAIQFLTPEYCAYDMWEAQELPALLRGTVESLPKSIQEATEAELFRLCIGSSFRNYSMHGQHVGNGTFGQGAFPFVPTSGPSLLEFKALAAAATREGAKRLVVELSEPALYQMLIDHASKFGSALGTALLNINSMGFDFAKYAVEGEWAYGRDLVFRTTSMPLRVTATKTVDGVTLTKLLGFKPRPGTESGVMLEPDFDWMRSAFECGANGIKETYEVCLLCAEGWTRADKAPVTPFEVQQFNLSLPRIEGVDTAFQNSYGNNQVRVISGPSLAGNCWNDRFQFGIRRAFHWKINNPRVAYNVLFRAPEYDVTLHEVHLKALNCRPDAVTVTTNPGDKPMGEPPLPSPTPTPAVGCLRLMQSVINAFPGDTVEIKVCREGGSSGAVTLDYAVGWAGSPGGAPFGAPNTSADDGVDYNDASGTLNWADGVAGCKVISVPILAGSAGMVYIGFNFESNPDIPWCTEGAPAGWIIIEAPIPCPTPMDPFAKITDPDATPGPTPTPTPTPTNTPMGLLAGEPEARKAAPAERRGARSAQRGRLFKKKAKSVVVSPAAPAPSPTPAD